MKNNNKFNKNFLLYELWLHISKKRKIQLSALLFLMIFTAFLEIVSLGTVLPLLAVLTEPNSLFENTKIRPILMILDINKPEEIIFPLILLFGIAALLSGLMRLFQTWANVKISFGTGAELSIEVYKKTLHQPYSVHVARNSSEIINAVANKSVGVITGSILPVVTIFTAIIILSSIMITLIIIDTFVALSSFAGFGLTYFLVILFTRKRLTKNSKLIAKKSTSVIKSLQEGLGGIRDVLIDGNQNEYSKIYSDTVHPLYKAQANNDFISQSPRFIIEAVGMVLIASLAYWLFFQPGGFTKAIPVLGTLVFGAQRMLPVLQQIYSSWSAIQSNKASLEDVLNLLNQSYEDTKNDFESLPFNKEIRLKDIIFKYKSDGPEIIRNVNITFTKGHRIGFIGETGSGKSTLLDILMGLLEPNNGQIIVDNNIVDLNNRKAWQLNISHVPQFIFLSDKSISENIAFGLPVENIDFERVKKAAKIAHIDSFINSLTNKYETLVGERGVRLSGGQRQRLGIARAFYKNAKVIIFDEATSSLDNQTEEIIMNSIFDSQKGMTFFLIAHRVSTLKNCDILIEIKNGKINKIGNYDEIIGNN